MNMENSEIIGLSCLVFYILGFIIHFRMFIKNENNLVDGWALVFVAFYFSIPSWFSVALTWSFDTNSKPPKWLIGKNNKI